MTYVIDPKRCSGCRKCLDECPMAAVAENGQGGYRIDPQMCTDCGSCADVCPEEAIRGG